MTEESIIRLAQLVREAQKRYFEERTPTNLTESKRLERELDKALMLYGKPQGTLGI